MPAAGTLSSVQYECVAGTAREHGFQAAILSVSNSAIAIEGEEVDLARAG